jgi:4-hydroxyphenylacetate 3-monooxygenase
MGARSGSDYLKAIKDLGAQVWLGGERVNDVTAHPAFAACARSVAALYDMQLARPDEMTYCAEGGEQLGLSFIQPASAQEVVKRGRMMRRWAEYSCGMMGRTPDYLNSTLAAMAAAYKFFAASEPRFGDNIVNYYRQARSRDWCATHTLVNPRKSRATGWAGHADNEVALRLVERTREGIIVKGCRVLATLAPLAEELQVFPSTVLKNEPAAKPFALAFAISCATPGLRFLCREPFDSLHSRFDHPFAARFEEMDCVVVFDDVLVPWERVFMCGDVDRCNNLYGETEAVIHMMHQVAVKNVVKSEFMLGLAVRIAQASDAMTLPHVRERLAEMIMTTEVMRACLRAAEADAARNKWNIFVPARSPIDVGRNLFPRLYPRLVEIIQLNSSSSLMATPSERDFQSEVAPDIDRYLAGADLNARDRVALYRLAWDVAGSSFGGRQLLYERFFFGDPVRMASALVDNTDLASCTRMVDDFLARAD